MNSEISIKLSEETALLYQNISDTEKQKIQLKIEEMINEELTKTKISENPWIKLAGKYQDDPQDNELLAYIEQYGCEFDAENQFNDSQFSEKEVKLPENKHSWHQFAGMYQNNPLFAEVLAEIETNRQCLDEEEE